MTSLLRLPRETLVAVSSYFISAADYVHFMQAHESISRLLDHTPTMAEAIRVISPDVSRVSDTDGDCSELAATVKNISSQRQAISHHKPLSSQSTGDTKHLPKHSQRPPLPLAMPALFSTGRGFFVMSEMIQFVY